MEYHQYKKLIAKKAREFAMSGDVPFDDLMQEGYVIFLKAEKEYCSSKAKFSTWLTIRLNQEFIRYQARWDKNKRDVVARYEDTIPDLEYGEESGTIYQVPGGSYNPEKLTAFYEQIDQLTEPAHMIVDLLITNPDGPASILGLVGNESAKCIRGKIKNYLRTKGVSWPRIWSSFSEIKGLINER